MRRLRVTAFMLSLTLLFSAVAGAWAQAASSFTDTPGHLRPGKTERFAFTSAQEGEARLVLRDAQGNTVDIREALHVRQGDNSLFWDGRTARGQNIRPGDYELVLQGPGIEAVASLEVGAPSPRLDGLSITDASLTPGSGDWMMIAHANMPGLLRLSILGDDLQQHEILFQHVPQGELHIPWDGTLAGKAVSPGLRTLSLTISDSSGFVSNANHILVQVMGERKQDPAAQVQPEAPAYEAAGKAEPARVATATAEAVPAEGEGGPLIAQGSTLPAALPALQYKIPSQEPIAQEDWGRDYWTTPVGEWNEAKIWEVMMQPITVLVGRDQRETYKLRKEPDARMDRENILGEITYVSQGVHVLETLDNGWSLVEANNSSYGPNNRSRRGYGNTDEIIRGYVETKLLETEQPRDDYGLLIDKLKQEMYVFKDGKLFTTLVISTGVPTRQQPWNETPSGEYLMVSRVGDFMAGNLTCAMGMRINGGSLIHEVPYLTNEETGYRDYGPQERQLGQKASHGCIRVQRKNNADGISMAWIWNSIKVNTKVLVWDDDNRYHEYPAADLSLYFNPNNGQYYHLDQNCPSIKDRFLPLPGIMSYADLDSPEYQKLKACPHCIPPKRPLEIRALNEANGY